MTEQDPLTIRQRQIVNKRLSLNLIIQGAATHAYWSGHHLMADQMNAISPELLPIYDIIMLRSRLGYWTGSIPAIMGDPVQFWNRLDVEEHEFRHDPFLVFHGHSLAVQTYEDVVRRCKEAGISTDGYDNEMAAISLYRQIVSLESGHLSELETLAKDAVHEMYGIEKHLLDAELTEYPRFGKIREPESERGQIILQCMAGWSAVHEQNGRLGVKAKAAFWSLLLHEVVKGTVELICLHGMNQLDDRDYELALEKTDHIEFEIPMLQIGGTIFQAFLAARPREIPLAECIMCFAKLDPLDLEQFMFDMIESPNRATDRIRAAAKA